MPKIEILPEGYEPDIESFGYMENRYYIIYEADEPDIVRVIKNPTGKKLTVLYTGSETDCLINSIVFVARIYLED